MLKYISLWIIDQVFSELSTPLKPKTQILYIRSLMFHFRELEPCLASTYSFDILHSDLPYQQHKKELDELHKAGLINIQDHTYNFVNTWSKYMDKEQLPPIDPVKFAGLTVHESIEHFETELLNSQMTLDHIGMKNRIPKVQVEQLIKLFISEQKATGKKFNNFTDVKHYAINWVRSNKDKVSFTAVSSGGTLLNQPKKN
jgi:hypothetical protein